MNQLSQADRELLERILLKDLNTLDQDDIDILNARVDYLTYPQKIAYASVLRNFEGSDVPPVMPAAPTEYTDPTAPVAPVTQEPVTPEGSITPEGDIRPGLTNQEGAGVTEATNPATTEGTTETTAPEAPVDPANPYDTNPEQTSELAQ